MSQPTATGTCPAATMDDLLALRPDVVRCPYAVYETARHDAPVEYSERLGGWVVTRHDDVLEVLRDATSYSNRLASGPSSVSGLAQKVLENESLPERTRVAAARRIELSKSRVLLFSDPPLHKRQRSLVNAGFTPRRVAELHDSVEELAHSLVDKMPETTAGFDIVPAFSTPIPMTVIATLLGVPPELMGMFKDWSNAFTRGVGALEHDNDAVVEIFDQVNAFYDYFTEEISKRQENPVDDLLSDLIAARLDGEEPLTLDEMLQMLVQFLVAGNETTTNLLTSAVWKLADDAVLQQRLREDPANLPLFVDEVLRLEAPVQGVWRVAVADTEIGGVRIPADGLIYLVTGSANRDSTAFEHPNELDIDNAGSRHLTFGRGEHVCLGMNLAKLEAKIALGVLLSRTKEVRIAKPDTDIPFHRSFVLHGIGSLPVTITRS
ncbi:Polyketide biosynthesis cytochrome P450 PksS [Mycolicibacterium vanbaalenii]|uniref:Steroid C26-monooxygenase n=1 Tax=Mycolicibacterium vanbaalenii TaxID=110539 RepID=A0A5S9R6K1_MYCVN|nr:cytochrome P450 [Mycolicibacterium vanbaalenii]CAA0129982.1 Polyketide biosynthesis cytochrome P450 PksS [Mycolicibacterium vanbaalenii]